MITNNPLIKKLCNQDGLLFCVEDYCRSNQPISLKLDVIIGATNRKNWLTFVAVPLSDVNRRSLFYVRHYCGIVRFISICHAVTSKCSWHLAKWLTPTRKWIHDIVGGICETSGLIWKSLIRIPDHFWLMLDAEAEVYAVWTQSGSCCGCCRRTWRQVHVVISAESINMRASATCLDRRLPLRLVYSLCTMPVSCGRTLLPRCWQLNNSIQQTATRPATARYPSMFDLSPV